MVPKDNFTFHFTIEKQGQQGCKKSVYMWTVCKVYGLTLLLQVITLWRCGDSLFFKVPPFASNPLLTMLHPLLENVLQTTDHFKISCPKFLFHGWRSPEITRGEI
jgi:hypothetical protein